jgi:hypothetical protein
VPDGRIQGRWTQKWPSKISCGLGSQRPRKRPNSKIPNCGLILTIIGKNWPKKLKQKFFTALLLMISGVAGLRPNFFLQRPNFLAELAQESWRDLAAVDWIHFCMEWLRTLNYKIFKIKPKKLKTCGG